MCDVKNEAVIKLLKDKIPQITISCDALTRQCSFQFWAGQKESFFCELDDCTFDRALSPLGNITKTTCDKVHCACYPNQLLCDPSGLDITEWFLSEEGPKGPGTFKCKETTVDVVVKRDCTFSGKADLTSEANMNEFISQFFGDAYFKLDCPLASECLHISQLPGYIPPIIGGISYFSPEAIGVMISAGFLIVLLGICAIQIYQHLSESPGAYLPVATADQLLLRQESMMQNHLPCSISFRNLSYSIDATNQNGNEISPDGVFILEDVCGLVKSGQVMAIMGGSGAGKTTFLDLLAKKNKSGRVTGDILVNGKFMNYKEYRNIIGYVDQEDTLMDTLTVYETILYSALLRLPQSMTFAAKKQRVQETMLELNIMSIGNRRIGNSGGTY